jgi:hypothetical protein
MKKAVLFSILTALCILASAQAPESFNYQVVVRDGSTNSPLTNQNVSFRMSILKGSSSGESKYSELHSANTGALGIVNLVIGNGTDKAGTISAIDWGADTYYLKVEIDKTGGTTYVEMGITQLLSVPYAMYAKSSTTAADAVKITGNQTITGDKTFSDKIIVTQQGIGTATPNASAALEINSISQGLLLSRMDENQMESLIPVEGLIIYNTSLKMPLCYNGTKWKKIDGSDIFKIGQEYQGGKIFYINDTGLHGLILAMQNGYLPYFGGSWGCYGTQINGADGVAVGTGTQNTNDIVAGCPTPGIAADICINLELNSYSDWFLPSIGELEIMFQHRTELGISPNNTYFLSSTEYDSNNAQALHTDHDGVYYISKSTAQSVAAVRVF